MKVYLVWQHEFYGPSLLLNVYADKEQAQNECDAYTLDAEEVEPYYYTVEVREVME